LLGVVGLELTEEMFAVKIDDLLLLDIRVDWTAGRETELLRAGLVENAECPFSGSEEESCNKHIQSYVNYNHDPPRYEQL
jgi:hypothetical protein